MDTSVRVRRRRSSIARAHGIEAVKRGGESSRWTSVPIERAKAAKEALASLNMFTHALEKRQLREATVRWPVERLMGVVSTRVYLAVIVLILVFLLVSNVAFPAPRIVTVTAPTVEQYDEISDRGPLCECQVVDQPYRDIVAVESTPDPMCTPDLLTASAECSKSFICVRAGVDTVLQSMATICRASMQVTETTAELTNSQRLISATLLSRSSFEALKLSAVEDTERTLTLTINVPWSQIDAVRRLERYVSLKGIRTGTVPETAVNLRTGGRRLSRTSASASSSRWQDFALQSCIGAGASKLTCESTPWCRWNETSSVCASTVCHSWLGINECASNEKCFPLVGGGCDVRPCSLQEDMATCVKPAEPGAGLPPMQAPMSQCEARQTPLGAPTCEDRRFVCQDFGNEGDCSNYAPRSLCRWDSAQSRCRFVEDWSCAGSAPRGPNCTLSEATDVVFNDFLASYLLEGPWEPAAEDALLQPDVLTFDHVLPNVEPFLQPLWRLASSDNCSCLSSAFCSIPVSSQLFPGEPNATWSWRCSLVDTVGSMGAGVLTSKVWTQGMGLSVAPMTGESAFDRFGDGFVHGFVRGWNSSSNSTYENYFARCRPSRCTFTTTDLPPPLLLISTILASMGGLAVVAQNAVIQFVEFLLPGRIRKLVEDNPDVYGTLPPEESVEEIVATLQEEEELDAEGAIPDWGAGKPRGSAARARHKGLLGGESQPAVELVSAGAARATDGEESSTSKENPLTSAGGPRADI